jgi:hypothetical protein
MLRYTTATRAVIIGAPEPVFAAVAAYVLYDEGMFSIVNYLGGAMMLAGVLLPLVHEEARYASSGAEKDRKEEGSKEDDDVETQLLHHQGEGVGAGEEPTDNPVLGHYGTSIHFIHHHASPVPGVDAGAGVGLGAGGGSIRVPKGVRHRGGAGSAPSAGGALSGSGGMSPRGLD